MTQTSFGIIFHPTFPPETLSDYARRAEAAGFDELWLWDDCFLPGALTSAAIALAATRTLRVGIGLMPATVYNPLFAAMEITTLARAFPGRIFPGFGHGVASWMTQIGAAPKSSLKTLGETVNAVRRLMAGESVTVDANDVHLDAVQMQLTPSEIPPLYVGAMREKSLQLAGRVGDGTILTAMSSPEYVRWARTQIESGMRETARPAHHIAVFMDVKVNADRETARHAVRHALAARLPWADVQLKALGIADDAANLVAQYGAESFVAHIPDAWVDAFAAAGTPQEAALAIERWREAGADTIVFQPLNGDPNCLDEYARELMPQLKRNL